MLKIMRKQVTDELIIEGLQKTWALCDESDYNSKKYMGLINDFIPYEEGLKAQLDIMARSGYLKKIQALHSADHNKIDKLMMKYMTTYGFSEEATRRAFALQLKALGHSIDIPSRPLSSRGHASSSASGGFSSKWLDTTETDHAIPTEGNKAIHQTDKQIGNQKDNQNGNQVREAPQTEEAKSGASLSQQEALKKDLKVYQKQRKKKWIRNKGNLFFIILLMALSVTAYGFMVNQFIDMNVLEEAINTYLKPLDLSNLWLVRGAVITLAATFIPILIYKISKKNVLPIIPLAVIFGQVASIILKTRAPIGYEFSQLALILIIMLVGFLTTIGSVRLPKGAKEFISYRAIGIYYITLIFYFAGQYFVRLSVV